MRKETRKLCETIAPIFPPDRRSGATRDGGGEVEHRLGGAHGLIDRLRAGAEKGIALTASFLVSGHRPLLS